jgi:membrane protease YdiL (CAAX protease family)/uncharacterized RDD family membrane protein YckC
MAPPGAELHLAGFGRRLGAFALDWALIAVIAVAGLTVGASLIRTAVPGTGPLPPVDQNLPLVLLGQLIDLLSLIVPPFVYPAIGWHSGATPGMRTLGLRVVDARSGDRLTWGQSLLRTTGWWWSLLTLGAGFVPILAGRWRRGLPDWMASSLVLSVQRLPLVWTPGPYGWAIGPARPPQPAPLIPTARDATEAKATRASWTWTDVVPVLVTFFPIMFGANWLGSGGALVLSYADEIAVYGASLLLIVLLVRWRRHTPLTTLGLRLPAWPWLVAGLPLGFAAYVLEDVGGVIGRIVLPTANATNQCVGIRGEFGGSVVLTLLAVAVIAPISEEIIFRSFTFRWLQGRMPLWGAVLVSAAIFSAAHAGWAEPSLFLPVFLGGVLLAYVYAKSRSVWPGVIIHMAINIVGVILILVYSGC